MRSTITLDWFHSSVEACSMNKVFHIEVPIQLSCGVNCVPRKFSGRMQLPNSSIINIADLKRNLTFAKDGVFQGAKIHKCS